MNSKFTRERRDTISSSPTLDCLVGRYDFEGANIPYLTAHMTAAQAANFLKTPEELPNWIDRETEVEALFQRQLDHSRVERKILPYLTKANTPKFFNAITIALVPYDHRNGKIVGFDADFLRAPEIPNQQSNYSNKIGPVNLGTWFELDSEDRSTYGVAEFCWNIDQVVCVAIDGQHRLAALKRLDRGTAERVTVCVIFLFPAAALGYSVGGDPNHPPLKLMRSVFIDLNKHAQVVKRSRLILLDDQDPHSLVVRRLLAEKLGDAGLDLSDDGRIPLNFVDWHTDEAKFDAGPYITTILSLDRVVTTLLGSKPIADWTAHKKIQKQLDGFVLYGFDASPAKFRLEELASEAHDVAWHNVFQYTTEELEEIAEVVGSALAKIITTVLYGLEVYREVLVRRCEANASSAKFTNWYEAYYTSEKTKSVDAYQLFNTVERHILNDDSAPRVERWRELLTDDLVEIKGNLLFKVVFQDGLFLALRNLWRLDLKSRLDWATVLVSVINRLTSRGVMQPKFCVIVDDLRSEFWLGSGLKLDLTVDFTDSGRTRIADWFRFATLLGYSVELFGDDGPEDYRDLLSELEVECTPIFNTLTTLQDALTFGNTANKGAMLRIAGAIHQGEEEETILAAANRQFESRAQFLLNTLR